MRTFLIAGLAVIAAGLYGRIDAAMSMPGVAIAFALTAAAPALPVVALPPHPTAG